MTLTRRLEAIAGLTTGLLGIAAGCQMLTMNIATARRLERDFSLAEEVLGAAFLYALPALLIAIGSYVHALKLRPWGLYLVLISSTFAVILFLLSLFNLAFRSPNLMFWLSLLVTSTAVATMMLSLLAPFRDASQVQK